MKRGYDGLRRLTLLASFQHRPPPVGEAVAPSRLRQHVPNPVVARLGSRALPTSFRRAAQVTWNFRNMYLKNGSSMYRFTQFNP